VPRPNDISMFILDMVCSNFVAGENSVSYQALKGSIGVLKSHMLFYSFFVKSSKGTAWFRSTPISILKSTRLARGNLCQLDRRL
jgi:hypothetical protein